MVEYRYIPREGNGFDYMPDTLYQLNSDTRDMRTYVDLEAVAFDTQKHADYFKAIPYNNAKRKGGEYKDEWLKQLRVNRAADDPHPSEILDALKSEKWRGYIYDGGAYPELSWDGRMKVIYDAFKKEWRTFVDVSALETVDDFNAMKEIAKKATNELRLRKDYAPKLNSSDGRYSTEGDNLIKLNSAGVVTETWELLSSYQDILPLVWDLEEEQRAEAARRAAEGEDAIEALLQEQNKILREQKAFLAEQGFTPAEDETGGSVSYKDENGELRQAQLQSQLTAADDGSIRIMPYARIYHDKRNNKTLVYIRREMITSCEMYNSIMRELRRVVGSLRYQRD